MIAKDRNVSGVSVADGSQEALFANKRLDKYTLPEQERSSSPWVPEAMKILEGRAIENEEFAFELYDSNGTLVGTASNNMNGDIEFDPIYFTKGDEGEHTYMMKETKGDAEDIIYDEEEKHVSVIVTYDNHREVYVVEQTAMPVFKNKAILPEKEEEPIVLPLTGKATMAGVAIASIALIVTGVIFAVRSATRRKTQRMATDQQQGKPA